jgi:16S rRNA processing protein RimM
VVRPRPTRPRLAETDGPDSDTPLAEVRLVVGTIAGPHGVRGEAKLRLVTDDPEHLSRIKRVYLGEETEPRRLLGLRLHAGKALIRIQGLTTPEEVDALRGQPVRIAGGDARPPAPGEFFLYQLIGLEAVDEAGTRLGRVADVMETGAHDIFVVSPIESGPDLLLPNHPDVVLDVQPDAGRMIVRPLVYG